MNKKPIITALLALVAMAGQAQEPFFCTGITGTVLNDPFSCELFCPMK